MKISICVCTSCHVNGANRIYEQLNNLITANKLTNKVELKAFFCNGDCADGVFVTVDDRKYTLTTDIVDLFFNEQIKSKLL